MPRYEAQTTIFMVPHPIEIVSDVALAPSEVAKRASDTIGSPAGSQGNAAGGEGALINSDGRSGAVQINPIVRPKP